jgi:hypothetical protein
MPECGVTDRALLWNSLGLGTETVTSFVTVPFSGKILWVRQ